MGKVKFMNGSQGHNHTPNFYGKLPINGDFIYRRFSNQFINHWDRWLQQCISGSQQQLQERWLDLYLTSPIWRYYLSAGLIDQHAYLGVLIPSADSVGRYFPFTVAVELPSGELPDLGGSACEQWFTQMEQVLLTVLESQSDTVETFDQKISELALSKDYLCSLQEKRHIFSVDSRGFHFNEQSPLTVNSPLLHYWLANSLEDGKELSIWWSEGSDLMSSCLNILPGLPSCHQFVSMLDGNWEESEWIATTQKKTHSIISPQTSELNFESTAEQPKLSETDYSVPPLQTFSTALSHQGNLRSNNEDAFLNQNQHGLWAVADGVGGHQDGEIASQTVTEQLNELLHSTDSGFDITHVIQKIKTTNRLLRDHYRNQPEQKSPSSTAAVLLIHENQGAVVWVGDSRVYLKRDGDLQQLTQDHSLVQEYQSQKGVSDLNGGPFPFKNIITRAVGATDQLEVDSFCFDVLPGDRYLLCSDGLTNELTDGEILEVLELGNIDLCCGELESRVLMGAARDNVTIVVVDVVADVAASS